MAAGLVDGGSRGARRPRRGRTDAAGCASAQAEAELALARSRVRRRPAAAPWRWLGGPRGGSRRLGADALGGCGPTRSLLGRRGRARSDAPRLLREGGAARRRAGRPGLRLAGDHRSAAQRARRASGAVRPRWRRRVLLGTARRIAARRSTYACSPTTSAPSWPRVRGRRADRAGAPAPWAGATCTSGRARSAASTCRPTSSATGTRLGVRGLALAVDSRQARGAVRVVRAGADAGQPGAAGAGARRTSRSSRT